MHCLRLDKKNHRVIYTVSDLPRIQNDNEIIIKVKIAGLCGTDLHIIEVSMIFSLTLLVFYLT